MLRGEAEQADAALLQLITEHLKPDQSELILKFDRGLRTPPAYKPQGFQTFRTEVAWRLPVADVLEANTSAIEGLFKRLGAASTGEGASQHLTLLDCLQLGPVLDASDRQITEAYSCSKMPPVDEEADADSYQRLTRAEFYEFLVRLAHLRFSNESGVSFPDKVAKTLDMAFKLTGDQVETCEIEGLVSSESDYESDY